MVDFTDIKKASLRIENIANKTPVMTSRTLDNLVGSRVFLKCENFQRTGSFKIRGAYNAVNLLLPEDRKRGLCTHSSGNHAQALALAATLHDISCVVVMPSNSSLVKIKAVLGYGAETLMCGPTPKDRSETTGALIEKKGYTLVHPYDNDNTIAGAGTAALEMNEEVKELNYLFCPVGGGGLISGSAIAAKSEVDGIKVVGVEPETANDAYLSFYGKKLVPNTKFDTLADGLRTSLCERTYRIIREYVDDIILVSDDEIVKAMRFLWERMKLVVEPSGAVSLAGIMKHKEELGGKRIGAILSGGNVNLEEFFKNYKATLKARKVT